MKVLFLTNIPSPYRVAFFNELGKQAELTVLFEKTRSAVRDASWAEYSFVHFTGIFLRGRAVAANTSICPEVRRFLDRSWDHIICADAATPTGMLAIQTMKNRRIPYWIEGDGGFAKSGVGFREKAKKHFYSGAKGYFSTGAAHDLYNLSYGADPAKLYRYPFTSLHAADILKDVPSYEEKTRLRSELDMAEENIVLFVGQMIPRKGIDILIEAAVRFEHVGFFLIGGAPTEEYAQLCESLRVRNVHFVAFQHPMELEKYYRAADLFVLPTREDIWGLVINEAMAKGLPVISTDRCGAALELIEDGANGYVVPVGDVDALTEAIRKTLASDRQKMGMRSLEIIRNYTIENMAAEHMRILGE